MAASKRQPIEVNGKTYWVTRHKSPVKAIREFCFTCMGMTRTAKDPPKPYDDVKECADDLCPLYDFRFGKNIYHNRVRKAQGTP